MEDERMPIQIDTVYRHFKGNYYKVVSFGYNYDNERIVIYEDKASARYYRPLSEWFTDVSDREDNTTQQTCRFELQEDYDLSLYDIPTTRLSKELERRAN